VTVAGWILTITLVSSIGPNREPTVLENSSVLYRSVDVCHEVGRQTSEYLTQDFQSVTWECRYVTTEPATKSADE
jgi:hypothetical protein